MTSSVSRTIRCSGTPDNAALRCLASLIGGERSLSFSDDAVASVEMTVSTRHPLTGVESSHSVRGFADVARAVCRLAPELGLWEGAGGIEAEARVEGWVRAAHAALSGADDAAAVNGFADVMEGHLTKTGGAYLAGDAPTAADVLCSVLLAGAAKKCGVSAAPAKVTVLVGTILGNAAVQKAAGEDLALVLKSAEGGGAPAGDASDVSDAMEGLAIDGGAAAGGGDFGENPVVAKLDALSIPHNTYGHKLSETADELVANVPLSDPATETHTKNLFFKDKKHGMFLVTTATDAEMNTKALGKALKLEGKVNLRLASEDILVEKLGCKKGCVGPLSIMNNSDKDVTLVLDEALLSKSKVHSHPLRNDASVALVPSDLLKFLKEIGVEPTILDFPKKSDAPAAPAVKKGESAKAASKPKIPPKDKSAAKDKGAAKNKDKKQTKNGETQLALKWNKEENFAMWYSDVITLSEMISYYDISGCYILRPWSYKIWELMQEWFNAEIKKLDVDNSYFPMFVSKDRLEKEKDHVEGFAPEVAWVTKSGDTDLAQPIAVRPTSETVMYPAFADWIRSHRDLPLKLNQWCNVVRWEFKDPTPFLRTREFLWQEGHTAHASNDDADVMVRQALDLYRRVYEELLAVPVVPGYKTEKEKFAGGDQTTTVEAYIPVAGRAIQGATSHNLGQNFGKMFDINYQDEKGETQVVWQTSWGLTTRTLGVMVMVHGDDTGLVLPPKIAPLQVVIVPIVSKKCTMEELTPYCEGLLEGMLKAGVRAKYDERTIYNPGWKYAHWEQKGVPIRIEVGPRDIEQKQARVVVRFGGEKIDVGMDEITDMVSKKLETVQSGMFAKAKEFRDAHLVKVTEWKDFVPNLELHNLVLTPWCGGEHQDWEEWVKEKSREESLKLSGEDGEDDTTATSVAAKTLCIPFDQPELPEGTKCIASGLPATCWVLWGRSY